MYSMVISAAICGISARKVVVEVDISSGLPVFGMVGYLAGEVREAQYRVKTSLRHMGVTLPAMRTTVNLRPADLRKEGTAYDLPIAAAMLGALEKIPDGCLEGVLMVGELGLDGEVLPVRGVMEIAAQARSFGCHTCIVPRANLEEGSVIKDVRVLGTRSLFETAEYLRGRGCLAEETINIEEIRQRQEAVGQPDFADLMGQRAVRRGAEIAAAGMHNLLLIGPPGGGKSMAARRIPSILPEMTMEEAMEVTRIHSIAGALPKGVGIMLHRPFRAPHHTVTEAAFAGGGRIPRPGEISLAHRGVLFLDEMTEFPRGILEILRQPMEDGTVMVSRYEGKFLFPADFMMVGAMNACPCGFYPQTACTCSESDIRRYMNKISQPLLDRFDLCARSESTTFEEISGDGPAESSRQIRERVEAARLIQVERYKETPWHCNSDLPFEALQTYCPLTDAQRSFLRDVYKVKHLSGRAYTRILRTARTIADLAGREQLSMEDVEEAVEFKQLDRTYWRYTERGSRHE